MIFFFVGCAVLEAHLTMSGKDIHRVPMQLVVSYLLLADWCFYILIINWLRLKLFF